MPVCDDALPGAGPATSLTDLRARAHTEPGIAVIQSRILASRTGLRASLAAAAALSSLLLLPVLTLAAQEPVTTCGQIVNNGFLTGDLDCSGYTDGPALIVNHRLNLAGFTLTGNPNERSILAGLSRIDGPGTITGGLVGITSSFKLKLTDLVITGNGANGVSAPRINGSGLTIVGNGASGIVQFKIPGTALQLGTLRLKDSAITDNGSVGIDSIGKSSLKRVDVLRNDGGGCVLRTASLKEINVSENLGDAVDGRHMKLKGAVVSNNLGDGVVASRLQARDVVVDNNLGDGIRLLQNNEEKISLTRVTVTNSGNYGVQVPDPDLSGKFSIKHSTVSGSCHTPVDIALCVDIGSCVEPKASNLACDTSGLCESAASNWGICGLD